MNKGLKNIPDEVLDEILDRKEDSEFEHLTKSEQKHLKDSTKHNKELMKMLSKL